MIESKVEIKVGLRNSSPVCLWVKFTDGYDPGLVNRIKSVYIQNGCTPAWDPKKGMWQAPLVLLGELLKAFPGFQLSPSVYDVKLEQKVEYLESVATKLHNDLRWLLIRSSYLTAKYSSTYFFDIPDATRNEQSLLYDKLQELSRRMYWSHGQVTQIHLSLAKNIKSTLIVGIHDVDVSGEDCNDRYETRGYISGRLVQIQEEEPKENEKDGDESLIGAAGYRLYMAENDLQYWAVPVEKGFESMVWW